MLCARGDKVADYCCLAVIWHGERVCEGEKRKNEERKEKRKWGWGGGVVILRLK